MTDRVAELRAVERIEMEVAHAAGVELAAQLGSDGRGDQLTGRGQVVEPFEQIVEPLRNARPAGLGEAARGRDVGHRQNAWTISASIPAAAASSRKRKKQSAEKKN